MKNQAKLSILLQNIETEEILYSSDSENEYHIVSKVIKVPKKIKKETKTVDAIAEKEEQGDLHVTSAKNDEETDMNMFVNSIEKKEDIQFEKQVTAEINTEFELITEITPNKSFICDYCQSKYATKCGLKKHMMIHLKDEPRAVSRPRRHRGETNASQYECSKCGQRMHNETYKQKHEQHCFSHLCNYCGKYFKKSANLSVHIMSHEKVRPFACNLCDKAFLIKRSLLDHMNNHAGVKPYRCPYENCNKSFALSTGVRQHVNCMHSEKKFVCQYCQHQCSTKFHLDCHIRTHNGDKPFKCNVCSAYFRLPSTLQKHQRVHTGERPYRCDICSKVSHEGFIKKLTTFR